jgi:hypothetical protein
METGPILITLCEVRGSASISYLDQCNLLNPSGLRHQRWHGYCCDPRPNAGSRPLWATSSRAADATGQRSTIKYRDRRAIQYREHSHRVLTVPNRSLLARGTALARAIPHAATSGSPWRAARLAAPQGCVAATGNRTFVDTIGFRGDTSTLPALAKNQPGVLACRSISALHFPIPNSTSAPWPPASSSGL